MQSNSLSVLFKEIDQLKEKISTRRPVSAEELASIKEYYRIGLTYTSNALEGNSLTETETKIVLEDGLTIGGKTLHDHFEAIGHSQAYDYVYTLLSAQLFTEHDIKQLHHLFYYRIDEQNAGRYRAVQVYISGSAFAVPKPQDVPACMQQFIASLPALYKKHPVEAAALVHKDFVFIHPFVDGNGRVARLLMNLVLLVHGYTIMLIPPLLRPEYIAALEKAHTNDHDFLIFIAEVVKESHKEYLRLFGR